MQGRRGMAWLALLVGLALSIFLPGTGRATDWQPGDFTLVAASSLDAQMLGEKPVLPPPHKLGILGSPPGLTTDGSTSTILQLPHNLELNVSFLYNRSATSIDSRRHSNSLPLFNYSMDYHFLPNFKVGLSAYLYHPYSFADQHLSFNRHLGDTVMGWGPGFKYDLGRWSFVVKSQVETGNHERGEDFQNWLRVWYAF